MVGDREEGLSDALDANAVLALCDRVIGEPGRRRHLFSWLRAPGAEAGQWLAVDAYYPGNRVVVLCADDPSEYDRLYAELVPAHGLRLLRLSGAALGDDAVGAEAALRRLIAEMALPARPTGAFAAASELAAAGSPGTIARVAAAFSQAGAAPPRTARAPGAHRVPSAGRLPAARAAGKGPEIEAAGIAVGLAMATIVCAEVYLGVGQLALNGEHWLLAFGISMDCCSRVLGAIAASRCGRRDWTWWSVIVGSPAVAWFVLYEGDRPLTIEPAPLAALLAVLAAGVITVAVLSAMLGL